MLSSISSPPFLVSHDYSCQLVLFMLAPTMATLSDEEEDYIAVAPRRDPGPAAPIPPPLFLPSRPPLSSPRPPHSNAPLPWPHPSFNLSPYSQRPAPVPPEMEIIDKHLDYINIVESVSKWQGVLLLVMLLIGWGISIFQLLLLVEVSSITCHDRSL